MSTHISLVRVFVLGSLLLTAGSAHAIKGAIMPWGGNSCVPDLASQGFVDRNQFGVHNLSTTSAATVWCPISVSVIGGTFGFIGAWPNSIVVCQGSASKAPFLMVYDRNNGADITCTWFLLNFDGTVNASVTASSSGFGSAAQQLTFLSDALVVELPSVIRCSLPPQTSNGVSHITSGKLLMCLPTA
jgi:hypothetical protein